MVMSATHLQVLTAVAVAVAGEADVTAAATASLGAQDAIPAYGFDRPYEPILKRERRAEIPALARVAPDPRATGALVVAADGGVLYRADAPPVARSEPVRILYIGSLPSDQAPLALTHEAETIGERLAVTTHGEEYRVVQHWNVEPHRLQGLILRNKPQIVHLSGHGKMTGELVFSDRSDTSDPRPVEPIACVFAVLNRYVRCVVLNACFSRRQAEAIAEHVDVVIGMGAAITDRDAIAFAGAFYEALGYGEDVAAAFELARNAIWLEPRVATTSRDIDAARPVSRGVPELFVRDGVNPSRIRFV
jgi:hypothetical protein